MRYTLFKRERYLKLVEKNLTKEDCLVHGKIIEEIYDNYDKENAKIVGYKLENDLYMLKERTKK